MRDILIKAIKRQCLSQIPVDFALCDSQIKDFNNRFGHDDYKAFFGVSHRSVTIDVDKTYINCNDLYPREILSLDIEFDEWGIGHSKGSELAFHMTRMNHPLKGADLTEIQNYPAPEIKSSALDKLKNEVLDIHKHNLAASGFMQMTIWETSWYLRSMEEFMIDMMMEDEKATILLDKVCELACTKASIYSESGVDIIELGDDIGTQSSEMMDLSLWQQWIQPRLKKVIDAARAVNPEIIIFYHSCGYITSFIDGLIKSGIDILNPIQPECMDFNEIYDKYGDRISFWGTIGTQQLLPYGTAEEVYETTIERLEKCKGTGIIIGPTHVVEPEVPWDNLLALKSAVEDFQTKNLQ